MRGPCNGEPRTWSGAKASSHKLPPPGAVGLSSDTDELDCVPIAIERRVPSQALICMSRSDDPETQQSPPNTPPYVVVARRYRPQAFDELVGQEHISRALSNAIATGRVGHAYLFTGARGVGKTSTARILARALNCQQGPTATPCNQCDICRSIIQGEDVDVLEIDGASNRGIDEIRQLRQNANVRPSRARFKIYIIDEVHMLTREAFNALLKTLEEPPEHVKFIFCTTEPAKIPITILSRCQRFDFAGILTKSIAERLRQIVAAEGVAAEPEALETLARRAGGSMRDSQSLLEQLLAFAPERITAADVHGMLGTAADECLMELIEHLIERDAAAVLKDLDTAIIQGVDVAQLLEQLLGYLRDCMAATVGCSPDAFLYCAPAKAPRAIAAGQRWGLQAILAAIQILDQTLARMRLSTQGRILAELALLRISQLEDLEALPEMIAQLRSGGVELSSGSAERRAVAAAAEVKPSPRPVDSGDAESSAAAKKNEEPIVNSSLEGTTEEAVRAELTPLTSQNATELWVRTVSSLSGMAADYAREFARIAVPAPARLVVTFRPGYAMAKSVCERAEQLGKFELALQRITGQRIRIEFTVDDGQPEGPAAAPRPVSQQQRIMEAMHQPLVRRAAELFGAQPIKVEDTTCSKD